MYTTDLGPGWGVHMTTLSPEWWMLAAFVLAPAFIIVVLWAIVWKGLALWHAARRGQYWWFIILAVVNTFGILEIIYLFFVAKLKVNNLFSLHSGHVAPDHNSHAHQDHSHHNHG
jgi:hypothetical protein